jgi:hypothetical protein
MSADSQKGGGGWQRHRALTIGISLAIFTASAWYIGHTFQWRELGQVLKNVNLLCLTAGGGPPLKNIGC